MHLNDFDYTLPENLIARYPLAERSASRLLELQPDGNILQRTMRDFAQLLRPNDIIVLNDTKVIPARLFAAKPTGGKVEVLLERIIDDSTAIAQCRASKPLRCGSRIEVAAGCEFEIMEKENGFYRLNSVDNNESIAEIFSRYGEMPLPPYMKRAAETMDNERYQTVYARKSGAVAAPTAGLHFTDDLLAEIKAKGIAVAKVTLHVGAGTFMPVRSTDIREHRMHQESIMLDAENCCAIREAQQQGGRVIAIGTTSVRVLESICAEFGELRPFSGETEIFIYPGFQFQCVDALLTNFHLPRSSLLMLVSAFAGRMRILQAYQQAVEANYRFFSYGDAMFLHRLVSDSEDRYNPKPKSTIS